MNAFSCLVIVTVCTFAAAAETHAAARVFWVAPDGDDEADGSQATPWETVSRAARAAGPGVTLNLRGGVYREAAVLQAAGGAEGAPLVICSSPGERAVLDGGLELEGALDVAVPHVVIRGLEIRNYRLFGIRLGGRNGGCHHALIERNIIHHISSSSPRGIGSGDGRGSTYGIHALGVSNCTIRNNTVYFVAGNNESFGVHFDLRSAYGNAVHEPVIEENLLYLIDKSGVRITDNWLKWFCLASPAQVAGNISVHHGYVGLEMNYVNTHVETGGPLGDEPGAPVYIEDNFTGWCGSHGINPKQSADGLIRHNAIYANRREGYLQSGHPSFRMRIAGNLIVDNVLGAMVHTPGEDNRYIGNYYRQPAGWPEFFGDRARGWGTLYTDMSAVRRDSQSPGTEADGVLDNDARLFRNPGAGDFRLLPDCPAVAAAPDGESFGPREDRLAGVGASGRWGLSRVPVLPELAGMRVVACSSEDPGPCPVNPDAHRYPQSRSPLAAQADKGFARHLVDGVTASTWRPAAGDMPAWAVIELPGPDPVPLGYVAVNVCHNRYRDECRCNVRDFRLHARVKEDEPWRRLGDYARYERASGRVFEIEGAPLARQIKIEVLSNHGTPGVVEVGELRVYRAFEPFE